MQVNESSPQLASWAEKLKDLTLSPLTRDYPEPPQEDKKKRSIEAVEFLPSSQNVEAALSQLRPLGSPSELLLTAFVVLVSRLTGDEDIAIGTNGKSNGPPFVLRVSVTPNQSFSQLAAKVQTALKESLDSLVPLAQICSHLKTNALFRFAAFCIAPGSTYNTGVEDPVDLQLDVLVSSSTFDLAARYNQRLFASARIATILRQLAQILRHVSSQPEQAVGGISMLTPEQRQLLPDPSSDLGWNDFRGAIHDIFSENARRSPDRLCVVETKSAGSPERAFTYRHIDQASNILAHHLVKSGIVRGEVVMVYSHRGVDLVVAVMGILKAGAAFSVLDPAYPPDRQNIYLEVAKPRALILIEKATQEAGKISEKVRKFIADSLELRTEVPGLSLSNDGSLFGGSKDKVDILQHVQELKDTGPGVVVGPDSTPTLSFTSGSEGKPKGVRGRHFSLAYYFEWMAKTFKLSEKDKYTLLSGISHDPVQRDIFTPLFLGAQLLVPSRDDIQNERLAEWMKEHGATVTHLTPAMGQILVGGASAQFDHLHHAFFVGDVLIKRDCRSLQSLAPNVSIVNMYGTTETQRAVSYYEIPSFASHEGYLDGMKDVIPAGKGMYNVQMLVVNRFDRTKLCAIGEVGEIYVRAGGLAEGYLGAPELTEKKFVSNWFVDPKTWQREYVTSSASGASIQPWQHYYLGPRDRLYRSGDLGRYTPTGDVECSGRADDQVKIRGFRIELGEIDTHLSQHPLVRENVTLVRRDKFEEQTLVSYVVPNMREWQTFVSELQIRDMQDDGSLGGRYQRFEILRKQVQEYLKTKLPVYAVPAVIIPMRAMPLNPNGKVDKPKLPFPDISSLRKPRRESSVATQLSDTEFSLAKIWAKLLPGEISPRGVRPDDSFFDQGATSMQAQRLPFEIRRQWRGVDLRIGIIYTHPTLKAMAAAIDRSIGKEDGQLTEANGVQTSESLPTTEYAQRATVLKDLLPTKFDHPPEGRAAKPVVFLTGATGFLGAYLLRDLLRRPGVRVVALVRAKTQGEAFGRMKTTCQAYGVWSESWEGRLECAIGNLDVSRFGLSKLDWASLAQKADFVIHNGAQVHWMNPYELLEPANVIGTIEAMKLCAEGKPKQFAFVSSTSVLDTDHYVFESERSIAAGGEGISEADDLEGSRTGLGTGYGQSKWVAEQLVREAGRRGLRGCIVRPGYVLGDSKTGVTNTDDFLIRMLKGCIQLSSRPNINNTVNMVPVDHVARVVVACVFHPPQATMSVAHVTGHPRLRFNQYLAALETYGYKVPITDYIPWTGALENYVSQSGKHGPQLALMPLFTFVVNDLPSDTRAPELDDSNAEKALYADADWTGEDVSVGAGVTKATVGVYLAYLVAIGFLPAPTSEAAVKTLPLRAVTPQQREALLQVGGRGALS